MPWKSVRTDLEIVLLLMHPKIVLAFSTAISDCRVKRKKIQTECQEVFLMARVVNQ